MTIVKVLLVCLCCVTLLADCTAAQQRVQCGIPKQKTNQLIVRGSPANPQNWPWHATIMHKKSTLEYACGGTLIHKNYVVTAKHCLVSEGTKYLLSAGEVRVQLGVQELYEAYDQQHMVRDVHVFEERSDLHNDIAILELRTSVQFNDHVLPACLIDWEMSPGELGTVIGFGFTEKNKVSSLLKMATMPVIDTGECLRADRTGFGGLLDEGLFCAGFLNGTTVCNGDSGGGFFVKKGNVWYLAGIVSFALESTSGDNRCRQDSYGAFTRVSKYLEWIRQTLGGQVLANPPMMMNSVTPRANPPMMMNSVTPRANPPMMMNSVTPRSCGLATRASEHPWFSVLYYGKKNPSVWYDYGIASIISERYVLLGTLESFKNSDYSDFRFIVGKDTKMIAFSRTDWNGVSYHRAAQIKSLIIKNNGESMFLVLFRLEEKITFNDFIQPICLPSETELPGAKPNQLNSWFKAYDYHYFYPTSLNSSTVDPSMCLEAFGQFPVDKRICAEDPECGAQKVSITSQQNGRQTLRGFKWDSNCDSGLMLVNKIEFYLGWILENMKP